MRRISRARCGFIIFSRGLRGAVQRRRALEDEPRVHAMIHHGLKLESTGLPHDLYDIVWHSARRCRRAARCGDEFRNVRYALYERIEKRRSTKPGCSRTSGGGRRCRGR